MPGNSNYYSHLLLSIAGITVASFCAVAITTSTKLMRSENELLGLNTMDELVLSRDPLSSLTKATSWINSTPLKSTDLKGKVVLVQFWTYSCINWRRTLPYMRAWSDKYKNQGLVAIGVHSPEFGFENNLDNVLEATKDMWIDYPVALDNNFDIWRSFDNHYWPALFFIDVNRQIKHSEFGEGKYEESEKLIQQLLTEAGATGVSSELATVNAHGVEASADWNNLKSNENYVGYERGERFVSPGGVYRDRSRQYSIPRKLNLNEWALSGEWKIEKQSIRLTSANGRITYRFHARDLHVVLGPLEKGRSVHFRVLIDGKPPGASHGSDVDSLGNGFIIQHRMYHLIRQPGHIDDALLEIEFLDSAIEAFVFTFG